MRLTIVPGTEVLQIDDARITFRNFSGEGDRYNREGDRNFALIIPDAETAELLQEKGWNVKIKPPREEGDDPFMYMKVNVKFNDRGPNCYLISGRNRVRLNEDTINRLDRVDIQSVDLDIRPYDWEMRGDTGRSAYLVSIQVHQRINDRFAEDEWPEE